MRLFRILITCFFIGVLCSAPISAQNLDIAGLPSTSSAGAYSTRKLRTTYTGFSMRVRRSSDNAEADIAFDGSGVLSASSTATITAVGTSGLTIGNTMSFSTFYNGNSCFVTIIYDQSGNNAHITQTVTANQPLIVSSGVLNMMNSKPALSFNGTNMWMNIGISSSLINTKGSVSSVHSQASLQSGFNAILAWTGGPASSVGFGPLNSLGEFGLYTTFGTLKLTPGGFVANSIYATNATWEFNGSNVSVTKNGETISGGLGTSFTQVVASGYLGRDNTAYFGGNLSEVIVFSTPLTIANRQTLENNQINNYVPPAISSFTPTSTGVGNTVTIKGLNLTGATAVKFGGTPATSFNVVSSTTITAVVPRGASGNVTVTLPSGDVNLAGFTYLDIPGNALNFDGVDDYVRVNNSPNFEFTTGTVELWARPTYASAAYNPTLIGNRNGTSCRWSYHMDANLGKLYLWNGTTYAVWNYTFSQNKWYHLAFTQDGSTIETFVNGVSLGTQTLTIPATTGLNLNIGYNGLNEFFKGSIDDIRIWNVVRTQAEIQANMNTNFMGNETGLTAYYRFDTGVPLATNTGLTTLVDATSNAQNGTLYNFFLSGSTSNWLESYAMVVPTPTAATNIGVASFTANWTAPSVGTVDNYILDVSTSPTFASFVTGYSSLSVAGTSRDVTGLLGNTIYYYRIRANKTSIANQGGYSINGSATTLIATNADLSNLTISSGTLSPSFSTGTTSYTATGVASSIITVTPTKVDINAIIEAQVNGGGFATVNSGSASAGLIINYGTNTIDVKVTAQNGTVKTYTITITKPYNTIDKIELTASTPAAGGYSLRLLSSAYTGPLARITIGSSYYDVYPDAINGSFSATSKISAPLSTYNAAVSTPTTNALSTIMSGISATVAIWYDQSSTNHATQSAAISQPRIISAGVIETTNGLPTIKFLGSSYFLIKSTDFINHLSGSIVYNATNTNTNTGSANTWYSMNGILGAEQSGGTSDFGYGIYNNKFTAGSGSIDNSVASGSIVNNGVSRINSWTRNNTSGAINLFSNGTADGSATMNAGSRIAVGTAGTVAIGAILTTPGGWPPYFYNGTISEMLLFGSVYTTTERSVLENNQANYYNISIPNNANLSALTLSKGVLSPNFTGSNTAYSANVLSSTTSTTVTPTAVVATATMQVRINGGTYTNVANSTASSALPLDEGSNIIDVKVTSQDGVLIKTYSITVTRAASSPTNADLSALSVSTGALSPAFTEGVLSYTTPDVVSATTSVTVTPTQSDVNATIKIRINEGTYTDILSGNTSSALLLNEGANTIDVQVTAADLTTIKTYSTTVNRAASSPTNADLVNLVLSTGTLSPAFSSGTTTYSASVSNATTSMTITPSKSDVNATIQMRLNGDTYTDITSGNTSSALLLNEGANTIDVQVTAGDLTTVKTYSTTICRLPTASISGNNGPICAGTNAIFTLTGTSGATVTYKLNGGSNATTVLTGGTATITVAASANQILNLVSITNGTCSQNLTGTSTVTVNALPTPSVSGATTGCLTVSLTAFGGSVYAWSGGATPSSAANSFTTSGTYTVTVTNTTTGCFAATSVNVTVKPATPIAYVDGSVTTSGNGSSWATAYKTIQEALTGCGVQQIWVKAGTYKPTAYPTGCGSCTSSRDYTFHLVNGIKLYGGFAGTETQLSERNWATNVTVLSGDFNGNDAITGTGATLAITNNTENAHHVVLSVNDVNTTVLDGFTITGGNANVANSYSVESKTVSRNNGGGMYNNGSSPTIANCIFNGNSTASLGGGIYSEATSNPAISNMTISKNKAVNGGGMYNASSSPNINTSLFNGNLATTSGGGIYNSVSAMSLANTFFIGNRATSTAGGGMFNAISPSIVINNSVFNTNSSPNGGGVYNTSSSLSIINSTFYANSATTSGAGAGISNVTSSNAIIKNCIIWGNTGTLGIFNSSSTPVVTYSIVQGASVYTGTGNSNADPLFNNTADLDGVDNIWRTADDGLRLACNSPAFNTGTNTGAPATDIVEAARPQFTTSDMGAYESTILLTPTAAITGTTTDCGTVNLTATGGATYAWSGGETPSVSTNSFTTSGSYTVTVTSAGGCTATTSTNITVKPLPTATITGTTTACVTVNLTATGGTTYTWSGGATPSTDVNSFTTSGSYTVTVTSADGCTATTSTNITVNLLPTAAITGNLTDCGTVNLTATGGTTYAWSGGATPSTDANSFTTSGSYTVTVTTADGCTATSSTNITVNPLPTVAITGNLTDCGTVNLTATGGTTYAWSGGAMPSMDANSFTTSGSYTVTITSADGCTSTSSTNITVNPLPTAAITGNLTDCGTVNLTATGGTTYSWSGGAMPSMDANSFTTSGSYTVTVTSADGCTATSSTNITVNSLPTVAITGNLTDCGTVNLTATGGTTYAWSGGVTPSTDANSFTTSGSYTVTVTSADGCTATTSTNITVNLLPTAAITGNLTDCGTVNLTATGGTTYAWSGGATPSMDANSFTTSGSYTVTVTSADGCTATSSTNITVNPLPTAAITGTLTDCGTVSLTATGGATYAWSGGATPSMDANSFTTSGSYTVTVTSADGCTASTSANITVNPLPTAAITGSTTACGTVNLMATGGTTYAWSGGETPSTDANSFTTSGSYTVTVTSADGCTSTSSTNITVNPLPTAAITGNLTDCGTVNLTATGGTTYVWSGGAAPSTDANSFTTSGTYTVTVTDSNGCSASTSATVNTLCIYTWTGATSSDWSTPTNWSPNGVPGSTDDVIIPSTLNKPMLPAGQNIQNLTLTGTNKIMLGNYDLCVNTITGGNADSYIVTDGTGSFTIKSLSVSTPTVFPIGTSETCYNPLSIQPTNSVNFTVSVKNKASKADFTGTIADFNKVAPRQWEITPSSTPGSTILTFTDCSGSLIPTTPRVGHYSASNLWEELPATYNTGVWTTTAASFSPFAIGEAGGFESVLPVEIISLTARNSGAVNILDWSTVTEHNSQYFEIQHSLNGEKFEPLGQINAVGESAVTTNYSFTHTNPAYATHYYRLKMVDKDGSFNFSLIVSISAMDNRVEALSFYPNPTKNNITITAPDYTHTMRLYNAYGKLVAISNFTPNEIDMKQLPAGVYFLHIGKDILKVIKQ